MKRIVNTNSKEISLHQKYAPEKVSFKPSGLWYALNLEWVEWCESEMPHWVKQYNIKIEIDESKMLIIKNWNQLMDFIKLYATPLSERYLAQQINWRKVIKKHSGIEIVNYHSMKWKNHHVLMNHMWFYGWDVDSGCIWDLSIIKNQKIV